MVVERGCGIEDCGESIKGALAQPDKDAPTNVADRIADVDLDLVAVRNARHLDRHIAAVVIAVANHGIDTFGDARDVSLVLSPRHFKGVQP